MLRIANDIVSSHPKVLEDPPPRVWFVGFGEYSLDFELWFFSHLEDGLTTRSALYEQLYAALREAGIEIPYTKQDIYIKEMPGR